MFNLKKKKEAEFEYGREGIVLRPIIKPVEKEYEKVVSSPVTDLHFNSVLGRWE